MESCSSLSFLLHPIPGKKVLGGVGGGAGVTEGAEAASPLSLFLSLGQRGELWIKDRSFKISTTKFLKLK